ncbi:MAG: hypothetical protein GDA44_08400 [Prochloron sp. SP5CPC1]|nr:hypothetical protein [Candidatus Paraprochloron terpiosi SP5CPC1]
MSLKIIESFDASFTLAPDTKMTLFELLTTGKFIAQISAQAGGTQVEFTELLFQPVPYSKKTSKGMPGEFEPYYNSDEHIIINVPPNFMFQAKILKPSRLCAIYRKVQEN